MFQTNPKNTSIKRVAAVLKQEDQNEVSKPVAYFSKKLTEAQKKRRRYISNVWQ